MSKIPDLFEPIVAWRIWAGCNPQGYLKALANSYYWTPGKVMQCICDSCGQPSKPTMDGTQGFYSFKTVKHMVEQEFRRGFNRYSYQTDYIVGQVYIWGTVIECEYGYRSEFAYPKALLISHDGHLERLRDVWNIPVSRWVTSQRCSTKSYIAQQ